MTVIPGGKHKLVADLKDGLGVVTRRECGRGNRVTPAKPCIFTCAPIPGNGDSNTIQSCYGCSPAKVLGGAVCANLHDVIVVLIDFSDSSCVGEKVNLVAEPPHPHDGSGGSPGWRRIYHAPTGAFRGKKGAALNLGHQLGAIGKNLTDEGMIVRFVLGGS